MTLCAGLKYKLYSLHRRHKMLSFHASHKLPGVLLASAVQKHVLDSSHVRFITPDVTRAADLVVA